VDWTPLVMKKRKKEIPKCTYVISCHGHPAAHNALECY